jgi:hypothetical protein
LKHVVRNLAAAAAVTVSTFSGSAAPAYAYPADCAILLCLAGGWPASAPCAYARAVFIRRITPWPIEPPLQIWRCPMGVSFENPEPVDRLLRLARMQAEPHWSSLPEPDAMHLVQAVGAGADIDISGPIFAFIRSINVFDVYLRQGLVGEGEDCRRTARIRHGSYDITGVMAPQQRCRRRFAVTKGSGRRAPVSPFVRFLSIGRITMAATASSRSITDILRIRTHRVRPHQALHRRLCEQPKMRKDARP